MGPTGPVTLAGDARIDLGAIAKGYIANRLAAHLQDLGLKRGRINLGGDLRLFDSGARPHSFRIGIRHPSPAVCWPPSPWPQPALPRAAAPSATPKWPAAACATSSIRARGFLWQVACRSRIVAPNATDADALATAVLTLGATEGRQLVESLPDVDAVLAVERDGPNDGDGGAGMAVLVTSGLARASPGPSPPSSQRVVLSFSEHESR